MLIWVFLHLVLSPGWHHYMAFVPFVLLWCRDKKKGRIFSGVGLFLILTPVFFLGSMEGVYVTYSSWGGTFGALLCTWLSLIQIAMSSFSLAEIDQEDTNKSHRGGTREQIII
jgi:hypothetical protein